jgi:hypothetical protein
MPAIGAAAADAVAPALTRPVTCARARRAAGRLRGRPRALCRGRAGPRAVSRRPRRALAATALPGQRDAHGGALCRCPPRRGGGPWRHRDADRRQRRALARRLDGRRAGQMALAAARASGDAALKSAAERLVADGADKPLLDVLMLDAQRWVVGAYGLALRQRRRRRNWPAWLEAAQPQGLAPVCARQHGDTLLLAGEQGLMLRSNDGGRTLPRLDVAVQGQLLCGRAAR